MKTNAKKRMVILLLLTILLANVYSVVNATSSGDPNLNLNKKTGSLTIKKYETGQTVEEGGHEPEGYKPLAGVTFKIYLVNPSKVDSVTDESIKELTEASMESLTDTYTYKSEKTTGDSGEAKFTDLELGRYLVIETKAPENVAKKTANFLVDIPQTTKEGNQLIYDVEVEPKNNTAYGDFTLTKEGRNGERLGGVEFILEKQDSSGSWNTYTRENGKTITLTTAESNDENVEKGQIKLTGLPVGKYRLIEKDVGSHTQYILDNHTTYEFNVTLEEDLTTKVTPDSVKISNENPQITKTEESGNESFNRGQEITFDVTVDVPTTIKSLETYKITDKMDEGLTFINEGFVVKGIERDSSSEVQIENSDYVLTPEDHIWTLTFTNSKLANFKTLKISYKAKLNENANVTSTGNKNTVTLEYSNKVTTDYKESPNEKTTTTTEDEEKVYTGGFVIEKRENNTSGNKLQGAKFKIALSEQDAKNGVYIKNPDSSSEDIVIETNSSGRAEYKGLEYGKESEDQEKSYWLVEVQAPTYQDGENTKSYNLLRQPIEVKVSKDSYTTTTTTPTVIVNKKGTILPQTGGIGTTIFTIIGMSLIVTGVVLWKKNNKEEEK